MKARKPKPQPLPKLYPLTPVEKLVLAKLFRERFADEDLRKHIERGIWIGNPDDGGTSVTLYLVGGEDRD